MEREDVAYGRIVNMCVMFLEMVTRLTFLGRARSGGYAINAAGDVVGAAQLAGGQLHAALWPANPV